MSIQRPQTATARQALRDEALRMVVYWAGDRVVCTLPVIAEALCVSERTLQRAFAAAGTTFKRERRDALQRLALELLLDGTDAAAVARECGYASVSALSVAFKAAFGVSIRDARRAASRHREATPGLGDSWSTAWMCSFLHRLTPAGRAEFRCFGTNHGVTVPSAHDGLGNFR
jgi:AraC-like DNA-binding protein